jgi:TonB family protein
MTAVATISTSVISSGKRLAIRMQASALNRVRQLAQSQRALGREASGFLLGALEAGAHGGAAGPVLVIHDFVELGPDCQPAPLFSYSSRLADRLERRLVTYAGESRPVGFFRTNFRHDPGPSQEDISLMLNHFGEDKVLLLVNIAGKRISAIFYSVGSAKTPGVAAGYPISLDGGDGPSAGVGARRWAAPEVFGGAPGVREKSAKASRGADRPAPDPGPVGSVSLAARAVSELQELKLASRTPAPDRAVAEADLQPADSAGELEAGPDGWPGSLRRISPVQIGLALACVAVVVLAGIEYRTLRLLGQQREDRDPDALDLRMDRSRGEDHWRLSWNRSAKLVRTAVRGHVSITDGYFQKELDLTSTDLQSGSIIYSPIADEVNFRLEVFAANADRPVSESIRVISHSWASPGASGMGRADRVPSAARDYESAASADPSGGLRDFDPDRARSRQSAPQDEGRQRTPRPFERPKRPGDVTVVSPSVNDLQLAPPVAFSPPSADRSMPLIAASPSTVLAAPPVKSAPSGAAGISDSAPARAPSPQASYSGPEPPVLLRRIDPAYPPTAAQQGVTGTVRLQGVVGKDGRLHDPRVLSGPMLLRYAAVEAVKQWIYKPALVNGQPVSAPAVVEIRFNPRLGSSH